MTSARMGFPKRFSRCSRSGPSAVSRRLATRNTLAGWKSVLRLGEKAEAKLSKRKQTKANHEKQSKRNPLPLPLPLPQAQVIQILRIWCRFLRSRPWRKKLRLVFTFRHTRRNTGIGQNSVRGKERFFQPSP